MNSFEGTALDSAIYEAARADRNLVQEYSTRCFRSAPDADTGDEKWVQEVAYRFSDGRAVTLVGAEPDSMTFPAAPGFEELIFEATAEGDPDTHDIAAAIEREPVIGWDLRREQGQELVAAITTKGIHGASWDRTHRGLCFPDGRVEWEWPWMEDQSLNGMCATVDDWIARIRHVWAINLAKDAERLKLRQQPCPSCGEAIPIELLTDFPF